MPRDSAVPSPKESPSTQVGVLRNAKVIQRDWNHDMSFKTSFGNISIMINNVMFSALLYRDAWESWKPLGLRNCRDESPLHASRNQELAYY